MKRRTGTPWLVAGALAACGAFARAEDAPGKVPADALRGLADRALAAAVASSGLATFALDDRSVEAGAGGPGPADAVRSEDAVRPEDVVAALHASSRARLVKLSSDPGLPRLHARFASLGPVPGKESPVEHELYLELEAPDRTLLHAKVTPLREEAPGGESARLGRLAAAFAARWLEKPAPVPITVVGAPGASGPEATALVERIIERLVGAKLVLVAPRTGAGDEERPRGVTLVAPRVVMAVSLAPGAGSVEIDGTDRAQGVVLFRYHDPPQASPSSAGLRMRKLAEAVDWRLRNGGFEGEPRGPRGKAWVVEATIDAGVEPGRGTTEGAARAELTLAARAALVGPERDRWTVEGKDGAATVAEAKRAGVDIIIAPSLRVAKDGKRWLALEVRSVAEDRLLAAPSVLAGSSERP